MNKKLYVKIVLILLCFCFGFNDFLISQEATAKEEIRLMKTYPFSDPNPMANIGRIYPYFRFDGFSTTGSEKEWKTIVLENPYIKLWIFPEIGGKLWGAVEKSTQKEFIYFNKVVKFRNIAMRGPWTSGGVEFNFGLIGHAPTTASPVDYLYRENPDGSVSCIIGAMDLPSRTQWRVNIRLPKDKAFISTECFWFNPTPLHQPLYHWMTAAQDEGSDLRFFYPGTNYIGHGGDAHPWPLHESGRDVSFYKNNNFGSSKSYHILGEYDEHFGGYWENQDFGYGHWALYDDKPGQKLWLWSLARDGGIWHDLLTDKDNNRQYVEPQTGLLFNQEAASSSLTPFKHAYFEPLSVNRWQEIWYPIKGIGGLVDGSPYGSLNVQQEGQNLHLAICALQDLNEDLVVKVGQAGIFSQRISLKPMEVYKRTVTLPESQGDVTVTVGEKKLFYSSNKEANKLQRPIIIDKDFDWLSPEGLFIAGEEYARQRDYPSALAKFHDCLEKDPSHIRAKTRIAELYFRRSKYDLALTYASRILAVDAYNPGGNFIYALINSRLGKRVDAKEAFGWAARSMEYRSASYAQLAVLFLQENDLFRAEEYARRSLDYNVYNLVGCQILAVIFRLRGEIDKAESFLDRLLEIDPLCHMARFERFLLDQEASSLEKFTSLIRNELPQETYLETALFYIQLGREKDAIQILKMAPSSPVLDTWLAWIYRKKDPDQSRVYLEKAVTASPYLVFPFRQESLPVFKWAASLHNSWKFRYYMGLILSHLDRLKETKKLFLECGQEPDFAAFYLTRGQLLLGESNPDKILDDFRKAMALEPKDWRAAHLMADYLLSLGRNEEALQISEEFYRYYPEHYVMAMDYARSLLSVDRFEDCLIVLQKAIILPYEGAWEGHDVYRQASILLSAQHLASGEYKKAVVQAEGAKAWPENLGVGRPFDSDERLENFVLARVFEEEGEREKARQMYQNIVEFTEKRKLSWDTNHIFGVMALKWLGKDQAAQSLLDSWTLARPAGNRAVMWASALLAQNTQDLSTLKNESGIRDRAFVLMLKVLDIFDIFAF
jgi:tetratricopeptide (TPR) repeat protein